MDLSRKLYPDEMQKLAQVIAEVSEKSFRRGWQQGIHQCENNGDWIDPATLRFSLRSTWAPDPCSGRGGMPAVNRLHIEEAALLHKKAGLSFVPLNDRMVADD